MVEKTLKEIKTFHQRQNPSTFIHNLQSFIRGIYLIRQMKIAQGQEDYLNWDIEINSLIEFILFANVRSQLNGEINFELWTKGPLKGYVVQFTSVIN